MYYRYPSVLGTPRKRSEQPLIQALESCVQPRECSRKPERNSSQGREVIEGDIDLREVFARQVYVARILRGGRCHLLSLHVPGCCSVPVYASIRAVERNFRAPG